MRIFFLAISFSLCFSLQAQNSQSQNGARSSALANTGLNLNDLWATDNNPAGLGSLEQLSAGISYRSHFLIKEMASKSAIIAIPASRGAFGLSINQFGYSLYNENRIGLSYGQNLSKTFALGIQLNYLNTSIAESYGSKSGLSGNVGLQARINEKLSLAALVKNPNRTKLAEYQDERYSSSISLGLAYEFSERVWLFSEIEKDLDFDENVKLALEYIPIQAFYFRLGYASKPTQTSFGFGLHLQDFVIDLSAGLYSDLGINPQVSIAYRLPKKKKLSDE